jgi:hypothetical protein
MGALYRNVANDPKFHTALLLGMEGLLSGMANQEGVKGSIKHGLKNLRAYINQIEGDTIRTTQELELHAQREEAKAKREEAKEQREEDKAKRETTSYRLKMGGMGLAALGGTLTAAGAYPPLAPIIPVGQLLMWMGGLLSAGGEGYKTFGDHQDKQAKKGKKAIAAGRNNNPAQQPPPAANATGT